MRVQIIFMQRTVDFWVGYSLTNKHGVVLVGPVARMDSLENTLRELPIILRHPEVYNPGLFAGEGIGRNLTTKT